MSTISGKQPDRKGRESSTRRHILEVAAEMLREDDKEHFRIAEIAERASVGVPTIYYYFSSLNELVAQAQIINYVELSRPVQSFDGQIDRAFENHDASDFWDAMTGHMETVWRAGEFDGSIGILRILTDIWADEGAKGILQEMMRDRVAYWTSAANTAQGLGWIASEQDAEMLVKVLWSAAIGHVVLGKEFFMADGEARVAAFAVRAMKYAGP